MTNDGSRESKRKACPLLVQSDTNPSLTVEGQSWTRTYFLECIGKRCAAYRGGNCMKFGETTVDIGEMEGTQDD